MSHTAKISQATAVLDFRNLPEDSVKKKKFDNIRARDFLCHQTVKISSICGYIHQADHARQSIAQ